MEWAERLEFRSPPFQRYRLANDGGNRDRAFEPLDRAEEVRIAAHLMILSRMSVRGLNGSTTSGNALLCFSINASFEPSQRSSVAKQLLRALDTAVVQKGVKLIARDGEDHHEPTAETIDFSSQQSAKRARRDLFGTPAPSSFIAAAPRFGLALWPSEAP
jgi:hypothetical protein